MWPYGPKYKTFTTLYKYWMLPHCIFILVFILMRVAFEKDKPPLWQVKMDFWLDFVYAIDMARQFLQPYQNENGKIVYNKKQIAYRYLFSYFIFDLYAFYPLGLLKYLSHWEDGSLDDVDNFAKQNFLRMPRFYKALLLPHVIRARFIPDHLNTLLRNLDLRVELQNVINTFLQLAFILHTTACFWMGVTDFNLNSFNNWICMNNLQDESVYVKYVAAFYWSTVTCTTVGYGDILPTNYYELTWTIFIILFGVAIFSGILSNLSSQFSEISRSNASNQERLQ